MGTTSFIRIPLAVLALSAAALAAAQGKAPATEAEKEIYAVYQSSFEADRLFGESKYAEAQPIYAKGLQRILNAAKRDPNVRYYEIPVKPAELPIARAMDIDVDEIAKPGTTSLTVIRFAEVLEKMESHALQVLGKDPNWSDDLILDRAVMAVLRVDPPMPDELVYPSLVRLRVAADKLEALFKRNRKLRDERLQGTSGKAALDDAKAKIAQLAPLADAAKTKMANTMPDGVRLSIEVEVNHMNQLEEALNGKGFAEDLRFERYVVAPEKWLATLTAQAKKEYDAAGKTMPADALKPVADRMAAVRKLAIAKAGTWTWPKLAAQPTITGKVKAQLTKNVPGVKVLKIGLNSLTWIINKNDLGIPESRHLSGLVLYQMPGEPLPRCSTFIYSEDYAGGGTYTPANGAESYPGTRWQKG